MQFCPLKSELIEFSHQNRSLCWLKMFRKIKRREIVINPLEIVGLVVSPVKPLDTRNIRFWIYIKLLLRCRAKTNFCRWNSSSHWHMTFDYTWIVGKPGIGMRPPPVPVDVVVVAILRKWKWEKTKWQACKNIKTTFWSSLTISTSTMSGKG